MQTVHRVFGNQYRDSVSLMQLSNILSNIDGVEQASMVMATAMNIELLKDAGLLTGELTAGSNDILLVVQGQAAVLDQVVARAAELLDESDNSDEAACAAQDNPHSITAALKDNPHLNIALISTPGEHAVNEAMKALRNGLHVMIFSDNVSEADELALKICARSRGLVVMGPDCGTAIINGIPLAFANVVRPGVIGAVAASGTGLQQVTVLADRFGVGVSQAIGTGGHDLSQAIGGISMLQGIEALDADPQTQVIALISKPPSPDVAATVLQAAAACRKPVVVNFLGMDPAELEGKGVYSACTLEDCARISVALAKGRDPAKLSPIKLDQIAIDAARLRLGKGQKYIRGLYSGGTFCFEATMMMNREISGVYSNTPISPQTRLDDVWDSRGHCLIDLGDDVFTRGRPHPMIDHRLRNERMVQEAKDPQTAVILFDVVLGYGAHSDPVGAMMPAIERAKLTARQDGRDLVMVGSVCGTEGDPQGIEQQSRKLMNAGILLAQSNVQAVKTAMAIVAEL